MIIRPERREEFPQIHELVKVAFQTAKVSDDDEQNFVDRLRRGEGYIPELALVAEEGGKLVGHIMLTRAHVTNGDDRHESLLLAPISVVLEHRGRGVGSALIRKSFELAAGMGYTSMLLVGDPAYYQRFGFKQAASFGIKPIASIPDQYVLARELTPNALRGVSGTADCF